MSRLSELIEKFCADGVEWRELGEVCDVITGGDPPEEFIRGSEPIGEFVYPIYSNGVGEKSIWGYAKTYKIKTRAVTFSSIGTIGFPQLRKSKFTPIIRLKTIIPKENEQLSVEFLKYVLEVARFSTNKSSLLNVNSKMIKQIKIPIPPLKVQEEIVRILDKFTDLVYELTRELTRRKKQYEYYRDKLLTFGDDVEWREIGECILEVQNISWKNNDENYYYIDLTSVDRYSHAIDDCENINFENAPSRAQRIVQFNDILFATTRPMLKRYCIIPMNYDKQICSTGFCVLRSNTELIFPKFLYHQISSTNFYKYIERMQTGSTYPSVTDKNVKKYKIPIPSLSEQKRIVNILDNFDKLCNDICEGIPAEIEARQKQYEYYRDKLLTFEPIKTKK